MNIPFAKSRLKRAIEQGLRNGKLSTELRELGDVVIKSRTDAEAICWGLEHIDHADRRVSQEQTHALAGLFQDVAGGDCPAADVLRERGLQLLARHFDSMAAKPDDANVDTLLFILKIFALCGTVEGTLKVVEAARQPIKPDGYLWSVILRQFAADHPERELLFKSLSQPLPEGFIAVSLLDAANALRIKGDSMPHPFDTPEGATRLAGWLSSQDSDQFSNAHSATAALPFISNPGRDTLLDLAMNHPDTGVRIEAAWAAAKIGREDGLRRLVDHCRDFKTAEKAKSHLQELGRRDAIPAEANDPDFAALAEFANWCAHPNELGRAPDELEIVDSRELSWPPEKLPKPFWLIKYTLRDTTGLDDDDEECGSVGSVTFCFFSYKLAQRPPEDGYAVHCFWEMENRGLIDESDVRAEAGEYQHMVAEWSGPTLENPQILFIAEMSPELGYPQRLVSLASARLNGEEGWVALDGKRSEWYPRAEQPSEASERVLLKLHVGRHLLGFSGKPDRRKYLSSKKTAKSPEELIAAYEKLLAKARKLTGKSQEDALDAFGPLGTHFAKYANSLMHAGRVADIRTLSREMAPHWDHASGLSSLGTVAFNCREFDLAEEFLCRFREKGANFERGEYMALLANIWYKGGKQDAARELLLDCLRRHLADGKTMTGSDVALSEKWFQGTRCAFVKLFPLDGQEFLDRHAIPESTLAKP